MSNRRVNYLLLKIGRSLVWLATKLGYSGARRWHDYLADRENKITRSVFAINHPGFLFISDSQQRETRSILKLLGNMMNFMHLCNGTFTWFAINIPYFSQGIFNENKGDIDIILKRPRKFGDYDADFTYRGFEVKTILVDKNNNAKSLKRGDRHYLKIKSQLSKLIDFGCEQVFYLEIYVIERGHVLVNEFPSGEVLVEMNKKVAMLKDMGCGYVVLLEEPASTMDDYAGGIWRMPINIIPSTNNTIKPEFDNLVNEIDRVFEQNGGFGRSGGGRGGLSQTIIYCRSCKRLSSIESFSEELFKCSNCGNTLV